MRTRMAVLSVTLAALACFSAYAQEEAGMKLHSDSFSPGGAIPRIHGYASGNVSPRLSWSGAPDGAKSFALICDDPDAPKAGGWVHWVLWDISSAGTCLPQELPGEELLPDGSRQGLNDWKETGWGGPQPPSGTHHYSFRLYALDARLGELGRPTREGLMGAMKGHILAQAELVGTFSAR